MFIQLVYALGSNGYSSSAIIPITFLCPIPFDSFAYIVVCPAFLGESALFS